MNESRLQPAAPRFPAGHPSGNSVQLWVRENAPFSGIYHLDRPSRPLKLKNRSNTALRHNLAGFKSCISSSQRTRILEEHPRLFWPGSGESGRFFLGSILRGTFGTSS